MAKISNVQASAADNKSPVAQMKDDPNRVERERDTAGRVIGVRKLSFLDVHRLTCVMGDHATNGPALQQAITAASVAEIDGEPVARPRTRAQLEALMARL